MENSSKIYWLENLLLKTEIREEIFFCKNIKEKTLTKNYFLCFSLALFFVELYFLFSFEEFCKWNIVRSAFSSAVLMIKLTSMKTGLLKCSFKIAVWLHAIVMH